MWQGAAPDSVEPDSSCQNPSAGAPAGTSSLWNGANTPVTRCRGPWHFIRLYSPCRVESFSVLPSRDTQPRGFQDFCRSSILAVRWPHSNHTPGLWALGVPLALPHQCPQKPHLGQQFPRCFLAHRAPRGSSPLSAVERRRVLWVTPGAQLGGKSRYK